MKFHPIALASPHDHPHLSGTRIRSDQLETRGIALGVQWSFHYYYLCRWIQLNDDDCCDADDVDDDDGVDVDVDDYSVQNCSRLHCVGHGYHSYSHLLTEKSCHDCSWGRYVVPRHYFRDSFVVDCDVAVATVVDCCAPDG